MRNDQEKADVLNSFFGIIFTKEDLVNTPDINPYHVHVDSSLNDVEFEEEEIVAILSKLDIIQISRPWRSAQEATWKEATVVPIYKKGKKAYQGTTGAGVTNINNL